MDLRNYDCLNDEEDCTGVDSGVIVVELGVASCPCGRWMEARTGHVTLPTFAPGFEATIVRVDEPSPILRWRDSWLIRYVCHGCQHYYLDFRHRMTQREAQAVVRSVTGIVRDQSAKGRASD